MNTILQQRIEEAARHYLLNEHVSPLNDVMHQADLKAEMQYHRDIEKAYIAGAIFALQNQWISVDEALPPISNVYNDEKWSDWVLIRTHKGGVYLDSYIFHKHTWTNNDDDVTHWMPVPELKGGEE